MSNAIKSATSIEQVVAAVNHASDESQATGVEYFGGTDCRTAEEMAGEYAFDAAESAGYGVEDDTIEAHLDILAEAGANFDAAKAMAEAIELRNADRRPAISNDKVTMLEYWNENEVSRLWVVGIGVAGGMTYQHNTSEDETYCDLSELLDNGLFAIPEDGSHQWHGAEGTVQEDGSWIWDGNGSLTDGRGNDYTGVQLFT